MNKQLLFSRITVVYKTEIHKRDSVKIVIVLV